MTTEPTAPLILVADDMPANLDVVKRMLGECGYRVRPAPNGRLALRAARTHPPDLVMLDIDMPEMDGFETCERLKEDARLVEVPVILVGTEATVQDKVKAFRCGAVDYIEKPYRLEEIRVRIQTHLRLRREASERRLAEDLLDRILNVSAEGVVYIDRDGVVRRANDTFLAQWNLKGEAVVGTRCRDLLGGMLCREGWGCDEGCGHRLAQVGGNSIENEMEMVLPDGARKVFADVRSLVKDCDGATLGVVINLRDVTERKREEQESRMTASLLRAAFESTNNGILVVDRERNIMAYNQQLLDMWEIGEDSVREGRGQAVLGAVVSKLVSPEEFVAGVEYLYAHPEEDEFRRLSLRNGKVIDGYSIPQRLEGRVVGRVWSCRDVTAEVRKGEAIEQQNERLQSLQRISSNPGTDEADVLQDIIAESCRLLGMERTYIGRVEGTTRTVEYAFPAEGQPAPGSRQELSEVCCGLAMAAAGPLLVHDLANSKYRDSPCCKRGFRAYAGVPVRTSRGDYGVLSFTRKTPRPVIFNEQDRDFILIIAGLVGAMLERLQSKRELLETNRELEAFNQAMVDREMRVIELKEEVNRLARELGRPEPYEEIWQDSSAGAAKADE